MTKKIKPGGYLRFLVPLLTDAKLLLELLLQPHAIPERRNMKRV